MTNAVLGTKTVWDYQGGEYLQWLVSGDVQIQVSSLAPGGSTIGGIFLDSPASSATAGTAAFVETNTTTSGNWVGTYGGQGYDIEGDPVELPSYASITITGVLTYTSAASTTDTRALESPAGGATRSSTEWFGTTYTIDVNLTDGQLHLLSIYALDWARAGRTEQFQVIDPLTGKVLDTEQLWSFQNGAYELWRVSGHVKIVVTVMGGPNASISGIFLDDATPIASANAASYVKTDATTSGNWVGVYGGQGYDIEGDPVKLPSYASITVGSGASTYTSAASTTDTRALESPAGGATRSSTEWFGTTFMIDVNLTDGQSHLLSIYAMDWARAGRTEQFQVIDPFDGEGPGHRDHLVVHQRGVLAVEGERARADRGDVRRRSQRGYQRNLPRRCDLVTLGRRRVGTKVGCDARRPGDGPEAGCSRTVGLAGRVGRDDAGAGQQRPGSAVAQGPGGAKAQPFGFVARAAH